MSTFYGSLQDAVVNGPNADANVGFGSLKVFTSSYTVVDGDEPQVADVIQWGTIPAGSQILGTMSFVSNSIGNAGATINLGDSTTPTALLAATDIGTAAAITYLDGINDDGAVYLTTDAMLLQSVVATDALLADQVVTVTIIYVQN